MGDARDYRAEYGYKPTWDEQRRKQEAAAEWFYGESDEQAERNAEEFLNEDTE